MPIVAVGSSILQGFNFAYLITVAVNSDGVNDRRCCCCRLLAGLGQVNLLARDLSMLFDTI